jgi:hypothetical protein
MYRFQNEIKAVTYVITLKKKRKCGVIENNKILFILYILEQHESYLFSLQTEKSRYFVLHKEG